MSWIIGASLSVLASMPGLLMAVWSAYHHGSGARLVPQLEMIGNISTMLVLASPLLTAGLLWQRRALLPAARSARLRWIIGSLLGQVLLAAGLLVGQLFIYFPFFEPNYLGVLLRSPDGRRTAYLYSASDGLICAYEILASAPGESMWAHRGGQISLNCEGMPKAPRLAWSED